MSLLNFCKLALGLLLSTTALMAQQKAPTITGDFSATTFGQWVLQIESTTSFRFYYDPATVDTLKINIRAHEKGFFALLNEIFEGTDFHYTLDGENNIYVVKGREIQNLPDDFFSSDPGKSKEPLAEAKAIQDYLNPEKIEKARALLEEKLHVVGTRTAKIGAGSATIAGHIMASSSGEPIIGALVVTETPNVGVVSDAFGYYALTLPKGPHQLTIKSVGMKSTLRRIVLYNEGQLDIEMDEEVTPLKEVTVESERDKNVAGMQ